nr:MAG TPA: hypothetical protein [Caudoviricetes sp.]
MLPPLPCAVSGGGGSTAHRPLETADRGRR